MKKFLSTGMVLAMALSFASFGCDEEKKDNTATLLLLVTVMDLLGGNCATIAKIDLAGVLGADHGVFVGSGTQVPKGGCVDTTTWYYGPVGDGGAEDQAVAQKAADKANAQLADVSDGLPGTGECVVTLATLAGATAANTAANVIAAAAGSPTFCYNIPAGSPGFKVTYCVNEAAMNANKAVIKRFVSSDIKTDLAFDVIYPTIVGGTFAAMQLGRPQAAFYDDAMNPIANTIDRSWAETMFKSNGGRKFMWAYLLVEEDTCTQWVVENYDGVKKQAARYGGTGIPGITADDADAVTNAVVMDLAYLGGTDPEDVVGQGLICCNPWEAGDCAVVTTQSTIASSTDNCADNALYTGW